MQLLPQLSIHMQNTLLGLATALRSTGTCKNIRPRFWNVPEYYITFQNILGSELIQICVQLRLLRHNCLAMRNAHTHTRPLFSVPSVNFPANPDCSVTKAQKKDPTLPMS